MPQCRIIILRAWVHLRAIEAGHLARLEMENSDAKHCGDEFGGGHLDLWFGRLWL
jgi:hypothetical protein